MTINGIKEEILIQRLINGDQTAFELLFRFYYPGLVVFTSNILLDKENAEEIVQDFFVRLWIKRKNINKGSSFKNFLFTSVKNSSINFLKREKIKSRIIDELKNMVANDTLYDPDLFIVSELQKRIEDACNKLPPRTKEVFGLSRFKCLSNDEIATRLNISKRTVETHISNALKILREKFKDYMFLLMMI